MDILESDVEQIRQLGMETGADEICGLLLTRPDTGPRLCQVPNRARNPRRNVVMLSDDMLDGVLELVGNPDRYPGDLTRDLVVWHTHPGGLVGPSMVDLEWRWTETLSQTRCLVVTIPSGEAVYF